MTSTAPASARSSRGGVRRVVACILGLCVLLVSLAAATSAEADYAPRNDDFVRQTTLWSEPGSATLTAATSEPGEPSHGALAMARSAWWAWTAPADGVAEVHVCSGAFTPLLGLYTGFDVAGLATVPTTTAPARCQLQSYEPYGRALRFQAVAGTVYRIAAATDVGLAGSVEVGVQMRPPGDDLADAAAFPMQGDWDVVQLIALGMATVEPGEPAHAGRVATHSTWYAYTPARDELVRVDTCLWTSPAASSTATIYRGTTMASLTEVASSRDAAGCGAAGEGAQVQALLQAGVAYRIAVTQDDPTSQPIDIEFAHSPRDDSAETPSPLQWSGEVDLAMATREPGEPDPAGEAGGRSRWQTITPDVSRTFEISTCEPVANSHAAPADTLLAVYEGAAGSPPGGLTPVTANDDGCPAGHGSLVRFRALAGHRYLLAIDSKGGVAATAELHVTATPLNDDRASATRFGYGAGGITTLATAEPGEPDHAGSPAARSLWYRWVAPRTGNARLTLCSASFDAVLSVYGVDPAAPALAEAAATPGCRYVDGTTFRVSSGPHLDLAVTGGRTYVIAVDGRNGAGGSIGGLIAQMTTVENDDFADAASLADPYDRPTPYVQVSSDSTAQLGEPAHAARPAEHTSWWRWTATRTGFVTLSTCTWRPQDGDDTTLAVYTGDSLSTLTPVAAADAGCGATGGEGRAKLSFYAVAGTIYRFVVDLHATMENATLSMSLPPRNDRFSDAGDLGSGGAGLFLNLDAASREPGEPDHAGQAGGRSMWYRWTAAHTGPVRVWTCAFVDTLLAVYTGERIDALTEIASNDDAGSTNCGDATNSRLTFRAQAGTTYRIAVDGKDGSSGRVELDLQTAPASDQFAGAQQLDARPSLTDLDLALGSAETGEPAHAGRPATRSGWMRFTPTTTSVVDAVSCAPDADTVLAAYTGTAVSSLTAVAADADGVGCGDDARGARISFTAVAGVTYSLAVDADAPTSAYIQFTLRAANDALADAQPLTATPGTAIDDTLRGATLQSGEPDHGAGPTAVSTWYRVHVASPGTVRLSVCSPFPLEATSTRLAAYRGTSIATLQPVADATSSGCVTASLGARIAFAADPSEDVLVAVAAPRDSAAGYTLRVEETPANDLFADATPIDPAGGTGYVPEAAGAGREPGEPQHAGRPGGHSVWWSYTPTADHTIAVHGCDRNADPLVAVYTGSAVDALTPVAIGIEEGAPYYCADLEFAARAGVTYHVAVDVDGGVPGTMWLDLRPRLRSNASFADAQPIAISNSRLGELLKPGPEPGEPVHAGLGRTGSVWYRLDAPRDELLDISSCGVSAVDTVVAVYTGSAVDALTEVASNDQDPAHAVCSFGDRDAHVAVQTHAGTTYWIAVDSANSSASGYFDLLASRRAPHDAFADPFELVPAVSVDAFTGTATAEPGEPAHDGLHAARSVWAAWTADRTGAAVVDACDMRDPNMRLAAYTGDSVDALTPVASNNESPACPGTGVGARMQFQAIAGQRYHIAVDEPLDYSTVRLTLHLPPPNDARGDAADLPAPGQGADVDLTAAGLDDGEPAHAGARGGGSAWYRVTPSATTELEVNSCATRLFDSVLAAYEPAGDDALTPVAEADDAPDCGPAGWGARLRWRAEAGHTYLVALASATAQRGPARIDVRSLPLDMTPHTRFTADVPRRTAQTTVSVAFDSDTAGASFQCRADRDASWSPCVSPVVRSGLSDGEHILAIRATADGITESEPVVAAFSVDRTPPVPTLDTPAAGAVVRPGQVDYWGRCGTRAGDLARYTAEFWHGATTSGPPDISVDGQCQPFYFWQQWLQVGRYTMVVVQSDDLGNTGSTAPRSFTVRDVNSPVRLDAPADGARTNAARPLFTGTVTGRGDSTVAIHVRAADAATTDPDLQLLVAPVADGTDQRPYSVSATADLPEGAYEATAEWQPQYGSIASSGPQVFVVDTSAPRARLESPSDGSWTSAGTVTVSGSADDGAGDVVVQIAGPSGSSSRHTVPVSAGAWTTDFSGLADGDHVITATQSDAAGNTTTTAPVTIHVDRTAPAPTIGAPRQGASLPAGSVVLSGAAGSLPGDRATVMLRLSGRDGASVLTREVTVVDGAWATSVQLAGGVYGATVEQSDAVGNGGESPLRSFAVVTPTPTPAPTRPPSPTARQAALIADGLLPGTGATLLASDDALGDTLFAVPGAAVILKASGRQTVAAAVCATTCATRVQATVKLDGQHANPIHTRALTSRVGARGRRLQIATDATLRTKIRRAHGATATITIRYTDVRGISHRARTRVRLTPPRRQAR